MHKDPYGLTELLGPSIESMGFILWGIEFHANTKNALLRVFIDHADGVNVDNCADVSHHIAGILDVHDPIKTAYTLEVSSPGLDRSFFSLAQMANYLEVPINFQLNTLIEGKRRFEAVLQKIEEDTLTVFIPKTKKKKKAVVDQEGETLIIPFHTIDKANLSPSFYF